MKNKIIVLFLALSTLSNAQVAFTATADKKIAPDETFKLMFTINIEGTMDVVVTDFVAPKFDNFIVRYSGPASSTETSIINGKESFKKTFIYTLKPRKKGRFKIASATIVYKGKTYTTKPITIKVGKLSKKQKRLKERRKTNRLTAEKLFSKETE